MEQTVLDVRNLTIKYKTDLETVHAVSGISFSLKEGETLGLVGETGAGKTTTALGIMRLLPERTGIVPEGTVNFEGRDLLTLSEQEMQKVRGSKISMIFQDPMTALNPVLPVGKQIGEALYLHNEENLSKQEIEKTMDTLNTAFEKLLDELFQDTAWDLSSDISVLNTMLAQEGLTEDGLKSGGK